MNPPTDHFQQTLFDHPFPLGGGPYLQHPSTYTQFTQFTHPSGAPQQYNQSPHQQYQQQQHGGESGIIDELLTQISGLEDRIIEWQNRAFYFEAAYNHTQGVCDSQATQIEHLHSQFISQSQTPQNPQNPQNPQYQMGCV